MLLHAISSAYHNLMPAGCYPFALLFLHCDASEVDVNVHPSKTEVRFRHGSAIHDFVRDTIRESLIESRPASSIPILPVSPIPAAPRASVQRAAALPFSEFTAMTEAVFIEPEPAASEPTEDGNEALPEVTVAPLLQAARAGDLPGAFTARRVLFAGFRIPMARSTNFLPIGIGSILSAHSPICGR